MNKYTVGQRIVTNKDFISEPGFAGKPTHSGAGFKGTVTDEQRITNGIYYVQFDDEKMGRQAVYEFEIEPELDIREWHRLNFWEANALQIARENGYVVGSDLDSGELGSDQVSGALARRLVELGLLVAKGGSDGVRQTYGLTPKGSELTNQAFTQWLKVGVRVMHIPTGKLATVTALTDAGINAIADDDTEFTLQGGGVFTPAPVVTDEETPTDNDDTDAREALQMRYYDYREDAKEQGASYLDYKAWLEDRVLGLQKARAAELEVLKPFATAAKEIRENRYSVFDALSVSVLYGWLEAAEKALKNAGVPLGNTDEDKALHQPSPDDLPF